MRLKFLLMCFLVCFQIIAQVGTNSAGFIENKGQVIDQKGNENHSVLYLLNTNGLNVQLKKNSFSYDIYETKHHKLSEKTNSILTGTQKTKSNTDELNYSTEYIYHRIDIDFLNSNLNVELVAEEKSTDYDNYYNVAHAKDGITNVHKYKKVTYKNIYNKIDVVFFIPKDAAKAVEYNFIIHPGGKTSDIQLKFNGAKTELTDNKIRMKVRFGEMEETLPLSWIENDNGREEIAVEYRKIDKNTFGFVSHAKSDKTIVIDPVPVRLWGTYYGGNSLETEASSIKVDNFENVVLTGQSSSVNNIATSNAFQVTGVDNANNGFIAKFNSNGVRIWGTYIGNILFDTTISDSVINSNNDIYIVGKTWDQDGLANNLTTSGSHREFGSPFSAEGLIMKFDQNGNRIWGTFYGGESNDEVNTISLDNQENIIIGGKTTSQSGISTSDGFISINPLSSFYPVGFFSKFNPSGIRTYGSYFLGKIRYSCVDQNNNVLFGGQYYENSDYPSISTPNAHQTQCYREDLFIIKFDSNFVRQWCTYYGGDEYTSAFGNSDRLSGLSTDNLNNIYIVGTTSSSNNIATVGSFKENLVFGSVDAFVVKFNLNGIRQWGTYFGGNNTTFEETGESGYVSSVGNIYLAGNSNNYYDGLLSTSDSFQPIPDGSNESFFTKFTTNGNLVWSSYYGTPSQDYSKKIYFKNNTIYLAGYSTGIATNGNDLGTPGTHMPNGGWDLYLAKFQDCLSSPETSSNSPICIGNTIQLNAFGGTSYTWTGPNGFNSTLQNPTIANANAAHSGEYNCVITGTGGCDGTSIVTIIVGNSNPPIPTVNPLPTITGDCNTIVPFPTAMSACDGIINGTTSNPLTYNLPGTYTIIWNYTDNNGNVATQNQTVVINSQLLATATTPQLFCIQENATINDIIITGQNIKWYDTLSAGNILANSTLLQNGVTYYASQTLNGCESVRIPVMITIQNTPTPSGVAQSFCSSQNPALHDIVVTGTNINWYATVTSTVVLPMNTALTDATTYYATQTENNCESENRLAITVSLINTLNATDFIQEFCDTLNNGGEIVNLSIYNSNLISDTANCTFDYYQTLTGAENESISAKITNFLNYNLVVGLNVVYVRILSNNGCHQIVTLQFTLFEEPKIAINDSVGLCENSNVTINAGNGFDSYLWSTGETTSSIVVSTAGTYSVRVAKNHTSIICTSTKNFTVVESNAATISEIITQDWTNNNNTITVMLSDVSIGEYEYSIDGMIFQNSNVFSGLDSGTYTITVRDKNGCGIVNEFVYLLVYPKFFTPNGDGYNDFWNIDYSRFEPGLKIELFDRYGKIIKQLFYNEQWDGRFNGAELPSSDYWFIVTRSNGEQHRGHFTLKR